MNVNPRHTQPKQLLIISLLLVILLLATALRFHRLGAQSLWYDEGVAYAHSLRSLPELIPLLQRNVHLPAYFTLLGWWQDLTGSSEFALRSLSALCSILSIAVVYALGKSLFHPMAGIAAAALVALNSFSITYAQEARMYALLAALAGGSMWLFLVFWSRGSPGSKPSRWTIVIGLGLLNALGLYTHVAYGLVIMTQVVLTLLWLPTARRLPQRLLDYLLANLVTLLLFSPWLGISLSQISAQPNLAQPVSLESLLWQLQGYFAFGNSFGSSLDDWALPLYLLLLMGLLPRGGASWSKLLLPPIWVIISVAIYLQLELSTRYLRFLLPAQLAFALWLGRGIWLLSSGIIIPHSMRQQKAWLRALPRLAAAVALCLLLLTQFNRLEALYHHPDFQRDDMRGLVRRIQDDLGADAAIIVSAAGLEELLRYYYDGEAPVYGLPTSPDAEQTRSQVREIIGKHDDLHVIFYGATEQDPRQIVETTLNTDAYEVFDIWVDDLRYVHYLSPPADSEIVAVDLAFADEITLQSYALNSTTLEPGAALQAQLVWQALASPSKRYKVFLQLLNADGILVAQRDSEPAAGSANTASWQAGATIIDNHALPLPMDLPAGDYRLIGGLYDINDADQRLPVNGATYAELAIITVK